MVAGEERAILLTGADGCIGSAIRADLRRSGTRVIALGHVPGPDIDLVANFASDEDLRAAVEKLPLGLAGLVFAHGTLEAGPIDRVSPKAWRALLDINLNSVYATIHYALPKLRSGSSIVLISSTAAFDHSPVGGPHYTVSKWGLNGLVRHLADDLGARNIRINSVCPGTVEGPMARALLSEEAYMQSLEGIPLRRAADPAEVATVVSFLLSPGSGYVTGVNLPVSGGYR